MQTNAVHKKDKLILKKKSFTCYMYVMPYWNWHNLSDCSYLLKVQSLLYGPIFYQKFKVNASDIPVLEQVHVKLLSTNLNKITFHYPNKTHCNELSFPTKSKKFKYK